MLGHLIQLVQSTGQADSTACPGDISSHLNKIASPEELRRATRHLQWHRLEHFWEPKEIASTKYAYLEDIS